MVQQDKTENPHQHTLKRSRPTEWRHVFYISTCTEPTEEQLLFSDHFFVSCQVILDHSFALTSPFVAVASGVAQVFMRGHPKDATALQLLCQRNH
eukprot:scaffold1787_cov165-Cylindrotheca_fusiformis.AAC.5